MRSCVLGRGGGEWGDKQKEGGRGLETGKGER